MDHLAPRSGGDLRTRELVNRVLVDVVTARTMITGDRFRILNRVDEFTNVRPSGNAKAMNHSVTGDKATMTAKATPPRTQASYVRPVPSVWLMRAVEADESGADQCDAKTDQTNGRSTSAQHIYSAWSLTGPRPNNPFHDGAAGSVDRSRYRQPHSRCFDVPTIVGRIDRADPHDDNRPLPRKLHASTPEPTMAARSPRCVTFILALTVFLQSATPVWAWGRLGHRVISRFAEKRLTPKAKATIAELLEPGESLADASLWADQNRGRLPKTAPWHYVDVPLDEPRYDSKFSGDVSAKGCVVDKIEEFRLTVKDRSKSVADRRFALRFLVHCVEDMHMPMHVADNRDKGGNRTQVRFFDRGTNCMRSGYRHDRAGQP